MRALGALVMALATTLAFAAPAAAQEDHFTITPYVWLPTFDGDLRFHIPPNNPSGPEFFPDISVGPVDYLENLSGVFMIAGEARYAPVSLFTDFIYLDFSDEDANVRSIDGSGPLPPIDVGSTFDLTGMLWTLAGGYDLIDSDSLRLQTFGGVRYLSVESEVNWRLSGPFGLFPESGSVENDSESWDGLVGARGEFRAGGWFFPYYADIGAGGSDLTWQALVGVGYRWGWGDVRLDYRALHYEDDDDLVQQMDFDGPALGATFRF